MTIALLVALASILSISAVQNLNMNDMNKDASISASSINNTYNSLVNKVNSAVNSAKEKISQLYDLDKVLIDNYISQAQSELDNANKLKNDILSLLQTNTNSAEINVLVTNFNNSKSRIEELCILIDVSLVESKVVSARSTWYRPSEKTYAQIKENVEMFKRVGINLIFLETFYHGCSAFRSDIPDIPYHPDLQASYTDTENNVTYNDYLSAFIACCKENDIEVHAWVENFYVGINQNTTIVKNHPDWVMYNDDGTFIQRKEGGPYIFIDPANRDVQNLLINYYNELFQKYPEVKGLNLDYIRYPVSNKSQDTGFAPEAMKGFYELLGKEFTEAQLADQNKMFNKFMQLFNKDYLLGGQAEVDSNYSKWMEYRKQVITDFVCRIKNEVKEPNKIVLSTAVFASISESLDSKKQDWQTWFKEGWIEIATPMAYYMSSSAVQSNVKTMISLGGNKCLYYTGIASSYSGLPAYQNKEFIMASYNAGACGYVIFSGAQIVGHTDVQNVLSSGVNNKWAVLPHAPIDKILEASFSDILDKADRLYIPAGAMTHGQKEELKTVFDEISAMEFSTNEEIESIYSRVLEIANDLTHYSSGYAKQRISENMKYLAEILKARAFMPILEEEIIPPETPVVPPETPVIPPDDGEDDSSDVDTGNKEDVSDGNENEENKGEAEDIIPEEPQKLGFFERIIQAIINFFKKLFGLA